MYLKICINAAWVNTGWVPNVHDNLSPLPAQEHSSPTPSNLCSALERELSASELINITAIHYLITGLSPLHFLIFVSFFFWSSTFLLFSLIHSINFIQYLLAYRVIFWDYSENIYYCIVGLGQNCPDLSGLTKVI